MRGFTGVTRALLLFLSVLAFPGVAGIAQAEGRQDRQFGDWRTFVMTGRATVFGLYAQDASEKNVELQMGKFKGQCNTTKVYVTIGFNEPASKDFSRQDVQGELRVDQHPVRKTKSRVETKAGDKTGGYEVHSFENPGTLLAEMAGGQIVRFKFTLDNKEYYYRFPLNGFRQAYERVAALCAQDGQGAGGSGQGQPAKPGKPKSDSDFFDTPKPSGGKPPKSDKDFF